MRQLRLVRRKNRTEDARMRNDARFAMQIAFRCLVG
jgi:hypothetical protein